MHVIVALDLAGFVAGWGGWDGVPGVVGVEGDGRSFTFGFGWGVRGVFFVG